MAGHIELRFDSEPGAIAHALSLRRDEPLLVFGLMGLPPSPPIAPEPPTPELPLLELLELLELVPVVFGSSLQPITVAVEAITHVKRMPQ